MSTHVILASTVYVGPADGSSGFKLAAGSEPAAFAAAGDGSTVYVRGADGAQVGTGTGNSGASIHFRPGTGGESLNGDGGAGGDFVITLPNGGDGTSNPGAAGRFVVKNEADAERFAVPVNNGTGPIEIQYARVQRLVVRPDSGAIMTLESADGNTTFGGADGNGYFYTAKNAAPADGNTSANRVHIWFDSTDGSARLMAKGKSADGTVVTGGVPLAGGVSPHVFSVTLNADTLTTATNMAEAAAIHSSRMTARLDLTRYSQARLIAEVVASSASANSPRVRLRYKTTYDLGSVGDYSDIGTSEVAVSLANTGMVVSSWVDLAAGAKADVRVICDRLGGDGVADPQVGSIRAEFR